MARSSCSREIGVCGECAVLTRRFFFFSFPTFRCRQRHACLVNRTAATEHIVKLKDIVEQQPPPDRAPPSGGGGIGGSSSGSGRGGGGAGSALLVEMDSSGQAGGGVPLDSSRDVPF